jgi:hypothetical protein
MFDLEEIAVERYIDDSTKVDGMNSFPEGPDVRVVASCRMCIVSEVVSAPWIHFQGLPFRVCQQAQVVHGVRFPAPLDPIVAANITIAVAQSTIEMADQRLNSLRRKKPLEPKLSPGEQRMDF